MFDRRYVLAIALTCASACFPFGEYQADSGGGGQGGSGAAAAGGSGGDGGGGAAPLDARALQIGSVEVDDLLDAAVDESGNVVIAVQYRGELTFGENLRLGEPGGGPSIAIIYYGRDLEPHWAHVLMDTSTVVEGKATHGATASVAFDGDGNIIVGGSYVADLKLDMGYTVSGYANSYLAKFRPNQSIAYARVFTDDNSQVATQVAVRKATGHAFLYGHGNFSISFGACPSLMLAPDFDVFIAEFDVAGNCVRELQFGEGSMEAGTLAVDDAAAGDILITGTYGKPVTFGRTPLTPQAGGTQRNVFFARLDTALMPKYALDVGPVAIANANLVAASPVGDETLLSGAMVPPLAIGALEAGFGMNDVYVARLDSMAQVTAENVFGGAGMDGGFSVRGPNGNARVYGHFVGTATVGDATPMSLANSRDIFIAELDASLTPATVEQIVGTGEDIIFAVGFANGEETLIGTFTQALELDTGTMETTGAADRDVFIYVRPLPGVD